MRIWDWYLNGMGERAIIDASGHTAAQWTALASGAVATSLLFVMQPAGSDVS